MHSESRPRHLWKLARVEEVLRGADGRARSAVVRVHSRGTQSTTLKRPLQCLYPLEVKCDPNIDSEPSDNVSKAQEPLRRSQRAAARAARDGIKACVQASELD